MLDSWFIWQEMLISSKKGDGEQHHLMITHSKNMYNEQIETQIWVGIDVRFFRLQAPFFWGNLGGFGRYMSLPNGQQQVSPSSKMGLPQTMETQILKLAANIREDLILNS